MNAPRVLSRRRHWMWLGVVLLGIAGPVPAEEDNIPAPRVLTAQEWAGVQAAHDDPRPEVRRAAEELMRYGAGGEWKINDQRTFYLSVPFTISDPASLPPWTRPPPDKEEAATPAVTPEAVLLLDHHDPEVVLEKLMTLGIANVRRFAPRIAALVFHRDEDVAEVAVRLLAEAGAKDQGDLLAVLAESRPALRSGIMTALAQFDDKRAVPIALKLLSTDAYYYAARVLEKLGGPEHGPAIAACLTSENEYVQTAALETLVAVKAVNEAAAIAELLKPGCDRFVLMAAVSALAELNATQYSGRIAPYLSDDDSDLVWRCLGALGKLRSREHAGRVRSLLNSLKTIPGDAPPGGGSGGALRVRCVQTLFRMGDITRREAVMELEAAVQVAGHHGVLQSFELFIELDAVESLEVLLRLRGGSLNLSHDIWSPPDALRKLGFDSRCQEIAWFLQSGDSLVVAGALDALGDFGAVEFAPEITALLSRSEPASVREMALTVLNRLRVKPDAIAIAALFDAEEPRVLRERALSLLEHLDAESVVDQIAALLIAEEPIGLRRPALKLFAGLKGAEPYADRLRTLTAADLPLDERLEALDVLLKVSPSKGLERLEEMLRPAVSRNERLAVLRMLESHPVKLAASLIAGLLAEEDEQILEGALDALPGSGDDEQVDQVLPLLHNENWNLQRNAAEVLCQLGPRGRSRLFEEATDPLLRGLAMTAMLGDQEADSAKMMNPGRVSPDALVARAVYWAKRREQGVAPALAESLVHDHAAVRAASVAALMVCGGEPVANLVPSCVEASLRFPDEAGSALLAAYLFSSREERAVLPWLGGSSEDSRPAVPAGQSEARELLTLLRGVWQRSDADDFPKLQRDAALRAEEIIRSALTEWRAADLPLLDAVAADLQAMPSMKDSAAAVANAVREVRANTPLRRALRWAAWILGGQLVLWLVVLLIYPWSAAAQRMMWNRALRRGLGWWVEPLVMRMPWLRDRMWRPFREQLVPPGEVLTFDEWTFFDAVRIAPESGAPCAALPVLRLWRGVGVLRGESGLGKTTLLQALVSAASRPAVLLRAVECGEGLTAAIQTRLPQGVRGDAKFLRALLVRGSPDVYVDAVQEAPAEVQARLTTDAESLPGGNILFTTQPCAWMPPAGAMVWDVQPLRAADIAPFLLKQGTAAIEAAGGQSLTERQAAFTARVQTFLNELSALPESDPRAVAQTRMLSNPMEAVLAAELLAAGQTPDPARLLAQRMEHLEEDFAAEQGGAFPARPLAAHLLAWRRSGRPDPDFVEFSGVASFLARHRLLRKIGETGWRFRHDKILDWFLRPVTAV